MAAYTSRGKRAHREAQSRPSRSSAEGRRLVTKTSAPPSSCSTISRPRSVLRSSATLRLPRLSSRKYAGSALPRWGSPSRGSSLTTSAPQSARMAAVAGPAMTTPSSTTRTPVSGPGTSGPAGAGALAGLVVLAAEERDLREQFGAQRGVQLTVPHPVDGRLDHGQRLGRLVGDLGGQRGGGAVELL